jgi:hypothetical protein
MRLATFLIVLILPLLGCVSGGTSPIIIQPVISQTSSVEGHGRFGSVLIGAYPWTYPIDWTGRGTITLQYPAVPHVLLEGELEWHPVFPTDAPKIAAEMAAGRFAVRE